MASRPGTRKRIQPFPLLRAADGSAFHRCTECGGTIAMALLDIHEYECNLLKRKRKRTVDTGFQECGKCGVLVDATISGNHECVTDDDVWNIKPKIIPEGSNVRLQIEAPVNNNSNNNNKFDVQKLPRSPFRFFMESFEKSCESDTKDWFQIDREGFQKWKDMTSEERMPFVIVAHVVDKAYEKILEEEAKLYEGKHISESANNYHSADQYIQPARWMVSEEYDSYES